MSGMWNRTLVYLGLREEPDDIYDDVPEQFVPEDDPHARHAPVRPADTSTPSAARPAPGEVRAARQQARVEEADASNVRSLRGPEGYVRAVPATARTAIVEVTTFDDVEGVGARFRTGQPVLFDVSGAEATDARRVVDFVSGVTYALRGGMEKVGSRAFLITPEGVELGDDERARLAGLGFRLAAGGDA